MRLSYANRSFGPSKPCALAVLTVLCCTALSGASLAQATINAANPLSFGRFVLPDFNSTGSITIQTDGNFTTSGSIYILDPPQIGEYQVNNGTPDTDFTITISPETMVMTGPTNPLVVDNFVIRPENPRTDALGQEDFTISARISSAGGGTNHANGSYNGNFDIILNF